MKKRVFISIMALAVAAELAVLAVFAAGDADNRQDTVAVNEVVKSVEAQWSAMENYRDNTGLDYVALDSDGTVLFKTRQGLSESINEAVIHRDTILDIEADGKTAGKIIIYNEGSLILQRQKDVAALCLAALILAQCGVCIGYNAYLNRTVIKPFHKLKEFAKRVAGGNFDIPLEMDRQNLFGAFTESFDIMRSELKKARIAEAEANAGKKELVAKLSHDIKTPVASIKAASEVGAAVAGDEKTRENYRQIIRKADQINMLITNLFTSTLEELRQLSVRPSNMESSQLKVLLANSDYLGRAVIPDIPACLLYADKLRLQQVFDNIFANSYKYANTNIDVVVSTGGNRLSVGIKDYGGGVAMEELPLIKEKYRRGSNAKDMEGAGLGLYISDYFMNEMRGELKVQNEEGGLKVTVVISFFQP
ncbi:MAG: HAMP domain-containing histidine kinase [Lachnospiraceae bacterium]|nr:HAMP domain-containing histidine kinase [Lachnospiraceae bacterium]